MYNIKLSTKNVFDEKYEKFTSSKRAAKLVSKYKDKTFEERTKKVFYLAVFMSFVCTCFSAFSEQFYLMDVLKPMVQSSLLSIILVAIIIGFIEYGKRDAMPYVFRSLLQYRKVDITNTIIVVLLVSSSVFLSFKGAELMPKKLGKSPDLISIDAIKSDYDNQIKTIDASIEKQEKTTWKGKITGQANDNIKALNSQKSILIGQRAAAIETAKTDNQTTITNHDIKAANEGLNIGYVTIICELLLLLIVGFIEYRDYRTISQFANIENSESNEVETTTTQTKFKSNNTPRQVEGRQEIKLYNDIDTTTRVPLETTNGVVKSCANCGDDFKPKNKVHKYCDTSCRIEAYEKRSGRKMTL